MALGKTAALLMGMVVLSGLCSLVVFQFFADAAAAPAPGLGVVDVEVLEDLRQLHVAVNDESLRLQRVGQEQRDEFEQQERRQRALADSQRQFFEEHQRTLRDVQLQVSEFLVASQAGQTQAAAAPEPARARKCDLDQLNPDLRKMFSSWELRATPARIFDASLYNGEWRMLKIRLAELNDTVHQFVLIEGTTTFTNNPKKLRYPAIRDNEFFFRYSDKVRHHVVGDNPPNLANAWAREHWYRDQLRWSVAGARDDDILLLSDVDEIPHPNMLECLRDRVMPQQYSVDMWAYYYSYDYVSDNGWVGTKMATLKQFRDKFGQLGNQFRGAGPALPGRNGWHCSYCFPIQDIVEKLKAFSHIEYSGPPYTDPPFIYDAIARGVRLFGGDVYKTRKQLPHALPRLVDVDPDVTYLKHRITDPELTAEQRATWKAPLTD